MIKHLKPRTKRELRKTLIKERYKNMNPMNKLLIISYFILFVMSTGISIFIDWRMLFLSCFALCVIISVIYDSLFKDLNHELLQC